jgi:hypothetical protein
MTNPDTVVKSSERVGSALYYTSLPGSCQSSNIAQGSVNNNNNNNNNNK